MKKIAALLVASVCDRRLLCGLAALLTLAAPALGRPDAAEHLEDFVHYARIAKIDLALAHGQALLETGITNADLADLLDDDRKLLERFQDAISRARFVPELEDLAAQIEIRVERGRLDLARDPDRIAEAITMLSGTFRAQGLARRRLEEAGEYAIPNMLRQITEGSDERLKLACEAMIRRIGRQAVTPLCAALADLDPVSQRIVCDLLGDIGWPHAAPFLGEVSVDEMVPGPVREAAARALQRVDGVEGDLSTLYANLGRQYFDQDESLIAFGQEATNNVWSYDLQSGLESQPVPTARPCSRRVSPTPSWRICSTTTESCSSGSKTPSAGPGSCRSSRISPRRSRYAWSADGSTWPATRSASRKRSPCSPARSALRGWPGGGWKRRVSTRFPTCSARSPRARTRG